MAQQRGRGREDQRVQRRLAAANAKALKAVSIPPALALLAGAAVSPRARQRRRDAEESAALQLDRAASERQQQRLGGSGGGHSSSDSSSHAHWPAHLQSAASAMRGGEASARLRAAREHTAHHARIGAHLLTVLLRRERARNLEFDDPQGEAETALRAAARAFEEWFVAQTAGGVTSVPVDVVRIASAAAAGGSGGSSGGSGGQLPPNAALALAQARLVGREHVCGAAGVLVATWEIVALLRAVSAGAAGNDDADDEHEDSELCWPEFEDLLEQQRAGDGHGAHGAGWASGWASRPARLPATLDGQFEQACGSSEEQRRGGGGGAAAAAAARGRRRAGALAPRAAMLLPVHRGDDVGMAVALAEGFSLHLPAPVRVARALRQTLSRRLFGAAEGEELLAWMLAQAEEEGGGGAGRRGRWRRS